MNIEEAKQRVENATPGERGVEHDRITDDWIVRAQSAPGMAGMYPHDIASFSRREDARQFAHASSDITEALDLLATQRARIEELERAAKPLAEIAEIFEDRIKFTPDDHCLYRWETSTRRVDLILGDLRRLRALIKEAEQDD